MDTPSRSRGRPAGRVYPECSTVRLPAGTFVRLDAVRGDMDRADLLRLLVMQGLAAMERRDAAE